MSDYQSGGWEPDANKMGNWREMFEPKRQAAPSPAGPRPPEWEEPPDTEAEDARIDPNVYRPWIVQRGRARPPLFLELRRYEPKSGLWQVWQMSYPHLIAVEFTGDTLLSLDFGTRQFAVQGHGLDGITEHIRRGNVLVIQEFNSHAWGKNQSEGTIDRITCR